MLERFYNTDSDIHIQLFKQTYAININGDVAHIADNGIGVSLTPQMVNGRKSVNLRNETNPLWIDLANLIAIAFKRVRNRIGDHLQQNILYRDADANNLHPSNLIWSYTTPMLHGDFRLIPGFTRYWIDRLGNVWNMEQQRSQSPYIDHYGYQTYGLTPDVGNRTMVGVHRLLALAYIPYPSNVDDLDVNHIDGIKSNIALDNLEWVTRQRNNTHACEHELRTDNKPILVRNAISLEVTRYRSHAECGRQLGVEPTLVDVRAKSNGQKVYPDGNQYKDESSTMDWAVPDLSGANGSSKIVSLLDKQTGGSTQYRSLGELARHLNVLPGTLSYRLRKGEWETDVIKVIKNAIQVPQPRDGLSDHS